MPQTINLNLKDADVSYLVNAFTAEECQRYLNLLFEETKWRHDDITLFGKTHKQPRLTALYANNNNPYSYSGIIMNPLILTSSLIEIKNKVEQLSNHTYSSCLLNLYRDGNDSNGWHSDDEKELGINPVIASVSFGEARWFHFKHKTQPDLKHKMLLENGSLLIMKGTTQHYWKHQIPKTKKKIGARINLTFRTIK